MPKLECFLVAESVSIDQTTNEASVFNILEHFRIPEFPTVLPKCAAFSLWRKEPGDEDRDWQALLEITLPDGSTPQFSLNFRFTASPRHRLTQRFLGLPLRREGELRFELRLNGEHVAEHLVTVERVDPIQAGGRRLAGNDG